MIPVDAFVEQMAAHLVGFDAQNTATPSLRKAWSQIWAILDEQIYGTPLDARWPVVPAELALGKTLAIKTYAAMMPLAGHPGVLVVVNRQVEADAMAATINEWAGAEVAKAYHRDVKDVKRSDMAPLAKYPVLVICHRRLELGLDQGSDRFGALFAFDGGRRKAVLVDESLEMVYMADVPSTELLRLIGLLPSRLSRQHADALDVLDSFVRAMRRGSGRARRLTTAELLAGVGISSERAQHLVEQLWDGVSTDKTIDTRVRRDLDGVLHAVLHQLDETEDIWQYTTRKTGKDSLHGHRLLSLPPRMRGVIFDATARLNFVYTSRPQEFRMVDVEPAKDYSHVEILTARGGRTGKDAVVSREKADKFAKMVLTDVLSALGASAKDRRVLVATHEKGEPSFQESPLARRFAVVETCHWNAITGENKWGACDVGVISTLPYLPVPADLATVMAAQERELGDDQLNDGGLAELRQVRAMRMAAELTQFIGRLQRGTTAAPVTVLLRLPDHLGQIDADQALVGLHDLGGRLHNAHQRLRH
jgi:hypothetical protein